MFAPIKGGSIEHIQGVDCWKPPVGYILDPMTGKLLHVGVAKSSTRSYEDCVWRIDERWAKLAKWEREESDMQRGAVARNRRLPEGQIPEAIPVHKELNKFRKEMWQFRLGGYWFYNNRTPTYITGTNWFYLSVFQGKFRTINKLPKYRNIDREYFYFWQHVYEDPDCFGMIETRKRQDGKSYRAGAIALDLATRTEDFHAGIQSKTDDDAAAFFDKNIIQPFRKLPSFFVPVSNLTGNRSTVKELRLTSSIARSEDTDELGSKISYRSSALKAYDGEPLGLYIGDEEGKTKLVDVEARWGIARYCLRDEEGKKTGCSIHTSTVEKAAEGGAAYNKLWRASNQYNMGDKKRTPSLLKKFFISSAHTRHMDKYGFADVVTTTAEILEEWALLEDRLRADSMRREPLEEKHAFMVDSSLCKYNPLALTERYEWLTYQPEAYVRGNFSWLGGVPDTKVVWTPNPNGRFLMMWMPPEDRQNVRITKNKYHFPGCKYQGCGGADPYDHAELTASSIYTMSMGALVIMKKPYMMDSSPVEGGPALIYSYRPNTPHDLYEDFLMAAVFYGIQILIEINKPGCDKYFKDRGYGGYSFQLPDKTKTGITSTAAKKGDGIPGQITDVTEQHLFTNLDKHYFPQLIDQFLNWDPTDTQPWDLAVACGYALMMMDEEGMTARKKERNKRKVYAVSEYMPFSRQRRTRQGIWGGA